MASEWTVTRGNQAVTARRSAPSTRAGAARRERDPADPPQEARPEIAGRGAVQPHRRRGGRERVHALREQAENHAAEHVARARGRQGRRCVGVDDGAPVGRGDHRVGAFQHDHGAAGARGGARARELVAGGVEQTRELALVRREHAGPADGLEERRTVPANTLERIGVEQARRGRSAAWRASARGSSRSTPAPGPIEQRVVARIGEQIDADRAAAPGGAP